MSRGGPEGSIQDLTAVVLLLGCFGHQRTQCEQHLLTSRLSTAQNALQGPAAAAEPPYPAKLLQEQLAAGDAGELEAMREALEAKARALMSGVVALVAPANEYPGALRRCAPGSCNCFCVLRDSFLCLLGDLITQLVVCLPHSPSNQSRKLSPRPLLHADHAERLRAQLQDLAAREARLNQQLAAMPVA